MGALATVIVAGCATGSPGPRQADPGTQQSRLRALGLASGSLLEPAAVTPEMVEWIRPQVPETGSGEERARGLLNAVASTEGLGLEYSPTFTGTAQEVFASRKANCLGFTHLLVGLGRAIGIPVYYLGFRQQPRYQREGDLVVVWEHVTAGFGEERDRLVLQLAVGPRFEYEEAVTLPDSTALAMHYSNRGAELLRESNLEEARDALLISVAVDPGWSHGWANLGVARRRLGDLDGAEVAYRRAIEQNSEHFQAYQNLAVLLWLRGRQDAADDLIRMLDRRENRDPFGYLLLGDLSVGSGRVDEARRFYRRALVRAPDSAEPLAALGLLAADQGKTRRAKRLLQKAEKRDSEEVRVIRLREALAAKVLEVPSAA